MILNRSAKTTLRSMLKQLLSMMSITAVKNWVYEPLSVPLTPISTLPRSTLQIMTPASMSHPLVGASQGSFNLLTIRERKSNDHIMNLGANM